MYRGQLARVLHINGRFGEHLGESHNGKAVVGQRAEHQHHHISDDVDLPRVGHQRLYVLHKQHDIHNVADVVYRQRAAQQPADGQPLSRRRS